MIVVLVVVVVVVVIAVEVLEDFLGTSTNNKVADDKVRIEWAEEHRSLFSVLLEMLLLLDLGGRVASMSVVESLRNKNNKVFEPSSMQLSDASDAS